MRWLAELAASAESEVLKSYPESAPRRRLDEVKAARNPVLTWNQDKKANQAKAKAA
jgi:glycine dehydrogenase subunit 2